MAEVQGVPGDVLVSNEMHVLVASGAVGKLLCVRKHDGKVLSIQPWNEKQYRDPGTDGTFEQCSLSANGRELVYEYTWGDPPNGHPIKSFRHVVAWSGPAL